MKRVIHILPVLITILIGSNSCKKSSEKPSSDIYVAGEADFKATIWENEVPTTLSDSASSVMKMFVSGNDIYAAGTISIKGIINAVYWKNGVATVLGPGEAYGIALMGGDIYTTGAVVGPNGNYQAVFWKNGSMSVLGLGKAYEIAVQGNDVYIAGATVDPSNEAEAAYWKNGVEVDLGPGAAYAISMQGTDVYIAGFSYDGTSSACYWKNKTLNYIDKGADATIYDLKVSGTDVYTAGCISNGNDQAVYWKNGNIVTLNNGSFTYAIAVAGSNVYTGGYFWHNPEYAAQFWTNSTLSTLSSGAGISMARDIIIVQK